LQSNGDSLLLKQGTAARASRSLDLLYYMWHSDTSGQLLAAEALRAADRGVRVRLLVDDSYLRGLDPTLKVIDKHPNIEIRVYNPYATRDNTLLNVFEFVFTGFRPNHRMHNKSWIVDGRIAIVGGRNVGDEYFGLDEGFHFRDLGVLLSGQAALEAQQDFDGYWNSSVVVPIDAIDDEVPELPTLAEARTTLERSRQQTIDSGILSTLAKDSTLEGAISARRGLGVGTAALVSDPAEKWLRRDQAPIGVAEVLRQHSDRAEHEVILISPYFVPGSKGARWLVDLEKRGVQVKVLTNSLNATDVAAVHGGYARYRKRLLRGGVEIYELKRSAAEAIMESSFRGSSRASLHTKAVIIDGHLSFVGSYNLDPRSTWLNTEMGVLIDDPDFARDVRAHYELALVPGASFTLSLEKGRLTWTEIKDGATVKHYREPTRSWSRRIVSFLARVLPVEKHL
jgi:putative cardiolipin synthase